MVQVSKRSKGKMTKSDSPYETAISHYYSISLNDNSMIVVCILTVVCVVTH